MVSNKNQLAKWLIDINMLDKFYLELEKKSLSKVV
jgi:hypothetical protein